MRNAKADVDAIYCVPTAMHSIDHKFKYLLISPSDQSSVLKPIRLWGEVFFFSDCKSARAVLMASN